MARIVRKRAAECLMNGECFRDEFMMQRENSGVALAGLDEREEKAAFCGAVACRSEARRPAGE